MNAALREMKIRGFVTGFMHAYSFKQRQQTMSFDQMKRMSLESAQRAKGMILESAEPIGQDAFYNACVFAHNAIDLWLEKPGQGRDMFRNMKDWLPIQREKYARAMAEYYVKWL